MRDDSKGCLAALFALGLIGAFCVGIVAAATLAAVVVLKWTAVL